MLRPLSVARFHRPLVAGVALLALSALVAACGGDSFRVELNPNIVVTPSQVTFQANAVEAGQTTTQLVTVTNSGESLLDIESIRLEYNSDAPDADGPGFFLEEAPPDGTQVAPLQQGDTLGAPEQIAIRIGYRRYDDDATRTARLVITHNDKADSPSIVEITVGGAGAALQATPDEVIFQNVQRGKFDDKLVTLFNTGGQNVLVSRIVLMGDDTFGLLLDPEDDTNIVGPGTATELNPPLEISAGRTYTMKVRFSPTDETPRGGTVVIVSDDPAHAEGLLVNLRGNHEGPCVQVEPPTVNFGAKLVGKSAALPVQLKSCGEQPLEISAISLSAESSENFELDTDSFAVSGQLGSWPLSGAPRAVNPNSAADFQIIYTPQAESPKDSNGDLIPEGATILVQTNTFEGEVPIEVVGFGTLTPCPTAVITLGNGGEEVAPQTLLNLSGRNSLANEGVITEWKWEVEQPPGSASVFFPSATAPEVEFEVNVAGRYTFRLEVRDAEAWSCVRASREVLVVPDEAIHIELTWDTPEDCDATDEGNGAGSDMDLHFVHLNNALKNPNGEDVYPPVQGDGIPEGYFDELWDTFWFFSSHDWGQVQVGEDDPSLDRDDVDGAGPENLNLNVPEPGLTYKLGVHYWNDHGFGKAIPTVNVFVFGTHKANVQGCPMTRFDMWEVGTIAWPSQDVEVWQCNGDPPTDGSNNWPEKPCPSASARAGASIEQCNGPNVVIPENCDAVILPNFKPQNFRIDLGP